MKLYIGGAYQGQDELARAENPGAEIMLDFHEAVRAALREDTKVLVEECIVGREIEVAVLEEHGAYTVAHPAEIDTGSSEFYDYETKYISDASSFYLPARLSEEKQDAH